MLRFAELVGPEGAKPFDDPAQDVLSYKAMRRCIGLVGFALPFVLFAAYASGRVPGKLPGSMSAFYYTNMGAYFIGTLCALGVFLFSYRYAPRDNWLSNVAAVLVTFVALCPTAPSGAARTVWNVLHLTAAFAFFVIVAVFAAFMFTRKQDQARWWERWALPWPRATAEDKRDWVYRICGVLTLAGPIAALIVDAAGGHVLFWGESVGVLAFSFSWLVKGQFRWLWRWAVFPDPPEPA